ncbi:MAG TPA: UdgX family uracil-DNA binding protein, partial [Acidimicrobiales bacterium]
RGAPGYDAAMARRTRLELLAADAADCKACDLWRLGTQTVFGEGPASAEVLLVGEQPGDQEDLAGEPFVGPAGRLLDDAMEAAGLARERTYVTNAVKHFKWKPRGKRRIHDKPNRTEVVACHRWLAAELDVVDPTVVVALGATAGQSLFGPSFRVGVSRGKVLDLDGRAVIATIHPSAVLRSRSSDDRAEAFGGLVSDLERAVQALRGAA